MDATTPSASDRPESDGLTDALTQAIEADMRAEDEAAHSAEAPTALTHDAFEAMARDAVTEMGGELLFSICVGPEDERRHVATARLGEGEAQEFVVLSMPVAGGGIRAEPVATSDDPVARIAVAYAGVAEALAAAA